MSTNTKTATTVAAAAANTETLKTETLKQEGRSRGQIAYEAYCGATDWKSLANGKPLPLWADVKPEIKEAWETSALALSVSVVSELVSESPADLEIGKLAAFIQGHAEMARFIAEGSPVDTAVEIIKHYRAGKVNAEQEREQFRQQLEGVMGMEGINIAAVTFRRTGNMIEFRHQLSQPESGELMEKIAALLEANGVKPA